MANITLKEMYCFDPEHTIYEFHTTTNRREMVLYQTDELFIEIDSHNLFQIMTKKFFDENCSAKFEVTIDYIWGYNFASGYRLIMLEWIYNYMMGITDSEKRYDCLHQVDAEKAEINSYTYTSSDCYYKMMLTIIKRLKIDFEELNRQKKLDFFDQDGKKNFSFKDHEIKFC